MNNKGKKILTITLILTMILTISLPTYAVESYTVKSGDVLWKIAENYGMTYQELAKINNLLDPNKIVEGQKLIIGDNSEMAVVTTSPAVVENVEASTTSTQLGAMDTPEIKAEIQKAIELAGDDESLILTQRQQCKSTTSGSGKEAFEPIQLFDNLYFIGTANVGVFIFTTSEGYIMIDSGYNYMPENNIIPDMEKLGLDPAMIKYILITHTGPDHVGGAKYFQDNYGTQIVMSKQELEQIPTNGGSLYGITPPDPAKCIIGADGEKLTLGDTTITMVYTPRTVGGGGLSYIAQVFDNGETHMWATYGNTNVTGTLEDKKLYRESVAKFLTYVDEYKVDVVISDHPFVDNSVPMIEELRNRQPGEPNPFVYTQERARRFFELLDQCAIVITLRQEAGLDETGTKLATAEDYAAVSKAPADVARPTEGQRPATPTAPVVNESTTAKPGDLDTPEIKAAIQKAVEIAGDDASLIGTQLQQCKMLEDLPVVHTEPGSEEHAEPTQLFDNLYYVGGTEVGVFIFDTTEGYIMIDSGYDYMPEDYIVPGMKALGLDPSKVKYILVTHSGPDHIGGLKYFQDNYGTKVIKTIDEVEDGKVTLGDTTINVIETPRKVGAGGLSYIAPVFDNGEAHMWATYGNTNVVGSLEDKEVYRESVANFLTYVDELKVDVVISNHPFVDGSIPMMEALRNRQEGEPNPFVYTQERARRFFELLDQSAVVAILRQEAGLDETGSKLAEPEESSTERPSGATSNRPGRPE